MIIMQDNYSPPLLTVVEVRVEHGFQSSYEIGVTGNGDDGAFEVGGVTTVIPDSMWD